MHTNDAGKYQYKYYTFLSVLYTTLLIASVLLPYKIISVFGFSEPGGIFIFPLTYLLGGAIAETYGKQLALRMVYSSLFCLLIFNVLIAIIIRLPSVSNAPNQEAFIQAYGHSVRLSIGCLVGLICSDLTNVYRITKLKIIFKGKYFLQRCLWSTGISELIFNVTTYFITYYGVISNAGLLKLIASSWLLKMIYSAALVFPVLLLMKFLKKSEQIHVNKISSKQDADAVLFKF